MKRLRSSSLPALISILLLGWAAQAWGQEEVSKGPATEPTLAEIQKEIADARTARQQEEWNAKVRADTLWVLITGMLVFFMNLGFACVESGFCRAKNAVNILSKNFIVFAAASIGFWLVGWGIMFGAGNDWYGSRGLWMVDGADHSPHADSLGTLVTQDIEKKYGIDLKEPAPEYEPLVAQIKELSDKATATTFARNEEEAKESGLPLAFTVSLEVPGKGKFESEYPADSFYWGDYPSISWATVPLWAKFFFQLVFCATAATIVSGAVAERIKYHSFILFSFIMAIAIYPVVGHWIWGGGYLQSQGFFDFAGSTQVHSVGGWAALAGVLVLGPRLGKFGADGKVHAIPGHNLTAATIGCFVLWFGWFGFNPGSTMAAVPNDIGLIAVTTNMAAAASTLSATLTAWLLLRKPDLGMTLNGSLAGLVAITAPCAFVSVSSSVIIGLIAGVLVVLGVLMFDRLRIDDPVGALSVHLLNGVFGTLCIGLFAEPGGLPKPGLLKGGGWEQLTIQATGVALAGGYVFLVALLAWIVLKFTVGIRVSAQEEMEGLDIGEHGNEAYHGFVMAAEVPVYTLAEPRPASTPPAAPRRFSVVIDGPQTDLLTSIWTDMCRPNGAPQPEEFLRIYPLMSTVRGNRFTFSGGDPEAVRTDVEKLFRSKIKGGPISVRIEV